MNGVFTFMRLSTFKTTFSTCSHETTHQPSMWKHQFHHKAKPHSNHSVSHEAACRCLEISLDDFKKMDRRKLTRCYRRLAKKTHPDRGGESHRFVEIKAAYEMLLQMK